MSRLVAWAQVLDALGRSRQVKILKELASFDLVGVEEPEQAQEGHIHFLSDTRRLPPKIPMETCWIVEERCLNEPKISLILDLARVNILSVPSIRWAMAQILPLFDARNHIALTEFKMIDGCWVHPSAQIDHSVKLYP
ncbi:MAG: hypothetical protein RMK80_08780, partial [Pseudobdellovibrionaceae bacterium]|nr:hypothetical protein [Pseudobdellovibrionaceae bacterium]